MGMWKLMKIHNFCSIKHPLNHKRLGKYIEKVWLFIYLCIHCLKKSAILEDLFFLLLFLKLIILYIYNYCYY